MRNFISLAFIAIQAALAGIVGQSLYANNTSSAQSVVQSTRPEKDAFTGKIIRNKVRIRLQPTLDSLVLHEVNRGDMLIIDREEQDFFAILPPKDMKGYIFRTFVLDNTVEGNHVNVRLHPSTEAPIVAQLNCGDKIESKVSSINPKWLEMPLPTNVRLYVSKDYVEKIGDADLLSKLETRQKEAKILLQKALEFSTVQLNKSYDTINIEELSQPFLHLIQNYSDFSEVTDIAKKKLAHIQDAFLQKKIAYLEEKTRSTHEEWQAKNALLVQEVLAKNNRLKQLEDESRHAIMKSLNNEIFSSKMQAWLDQEQALYHSWLAEHGNEQSMDYFYNQQISHAEQIQGYVENYDRPLKNKPGDFMLFGKNNMPVAYLYSTQVDLSAYVGKEVMLTVAKRPNHNFAFPAYFVLTVH